MKIIYFSIALAFSIIAVYAQPIPTDSMYLGQIPPGNTPKKFELAVSIGFAALERIAIPGNGKSIFYPENNGYEPTSVSRIKYYSYEIDKWTGPFVLFEKASYPALSVTGDTMYMMMDKFMKYSVKKENGWTEPNKFNLKIAKWHYLQATNSGTFYAAMDNAQGNIGKRDWSKITINKTDTIIESLGLPINTTSDDLDFYISRDESYIILSSQAHRNSGQYGYADLYISYRKTNNLWTNPKNLGKQININNPADGRWGPFVSPDGKYLFYSRGSSIVDGCTNWVRIDNIVDSLKRTNFTPYVKTRLVDQTDSFGNFFSFTIPDSTFIDDDGNNTLTYSATLSNGNPLPSWLHFDAITKTFSGIPDTLETFLIKVTLTDAAKVSVNTQFTLKIKDNPTSINHFDKTSKKQKGIKNEKDTFLNADRI